MIQYANRALQDLYDIIPEMQSASTRSSRGLCDACATYVFGPLFNLASKTDIQRVADLVRQSQRSSMRALSQFQKGQERFTSFAAVTNQKFETLQHMVSAQHTLMSQLQRKVSAEIADIQVELQTQLDFIQQLASFVLELADIQEICSALIHLKHFALTNNLVPWAHMKKVLSEITRSLEETGSQLRIVHADPLQLYNTKDLFFFRLNDTIHISVKLKLSPFKQHVQLYRVNVFPLTISSESSHTTQLTQLPAYIAFNDVDDWYLTFDERPHLDRDFLYHADSTMQPFLHKGYRSCIFSLINDDFAGIKELCNHSLILYSNKPRVWVLSPSTLLLFSIPKYSLHCLNGTVRESLPGCLSCKVNIPCSCQFDTEYASYVPRMIHCEPVAEGDITSTITQSHLVNIPLLSQYFPDHIISRFSSGYGVDKPLDIQWPDLKVYESRYADSIASLSEQSLNLNQIVNQSKTDSVIFQSLSHKLAYDLEQSELNIAAESISMQGWQFWLFAFTTLATIILGAAVVILFLRVRSLAFALCLMNKPIATLAQEELSSDPAEMLVQYIQSVAAAKSTPPPSLLLTYKPQLSEQIHALDVIICLLFLAFWAFLAFHFYRAKRCPHKIRLIAEIGNQRSCVRVHLLTLRHTTEMYTFEATKFVSSISVEGYRCPRLRITWPDFRITHKITPLAYTLNENFSLSYFQAFKLNEILHGQYYLLMWLQDARTRSFQLVKLRNSQWSQFARLGTQPIPLDPLPSIGLYPQLPAYIAEARDLESSPVDIA
jgi:hypothetical protein